MENTGVLMYLLGEGYEVNFSTVAKRMANEQGHRDWFERHVWTVSFGNTVKDCRWEGFDTAEECVSDLVENFKHLPIHKIQEALAPRINMMQEYGLFDHFFIKENT